MKRSIRNPCTNVTNLPKFDQEHWIIFSRQNLWAACFYILTACSTRAGYTVGPNGHQYLRCDRKQNQAAAKGVCQQDGAHLVTISNQAEQDFVRNLPM